MSRAGSFTGSSAAFHDIFSVGAVLNVVALLVPGNSLVGVIGIGNAGVVNAVFLTKLQCIGLAMLHALTAGHAVFLVDPGNIVGADGVLGAEQLGYTQGVAGAAAAVTYCGGILKAGSLVYLVDKTVFLGALEYLVHLFLGNGAVCTGLDEVNGIIVEIDAHIVLKMSAAFADKAAGTAAGAGAYGESERFLNKGAQLVVGGGAGVIFNCGHDGHNAHKAHAGLAGVESGYQHFKSAAGVFLKAGAEIRISVALLTVGENTFHNAGHPDGIVVVEHTVNHATADDTCHNQLIDLLLNKCHIFLAASCQLFGSTVFLKTHMHHYFAHVVIYYRGENPVLRVFVSNAGVGERLKAYLCSQFKYVWPVCHSLTPFFLSQINVVSKQTVLIC